MLQDHEKADFVKSQIQSPIDKAIAARNAAKRLPDPHAAEQARFRSVDAPPADFRPENFADLPAQDAIAGLQNVWLKVSEVAKDQSVDLKDLSDVSEKALRTALARADTTLSSLNKARDDQIQAVETKIAPEISDVLALEIRNAVAGKNIGQLQTAIQADARVFSALAGLPAVIVGRDPKDIQLARNAAIQFHAQAEQESLKSTEKQISALERLRDRSINIIGSAIRRWRGEQNKSLQELKDAT